ncbi:unnamed protein product, partial [Gordionus sp. m RMFG-2023]
PYKESGKIYKELISISPHTRYIALYYDNPYKVLPSERRYLVGALLSESNESIDKDLLNKLKQSGYSEWDFPTVDNALNTQFPYKNTLSIYLSAWRVYTAITKFIEANKIDVGPCIEVWDNDIVYYMCPLDHKEQFYVKEINP